MTKDNSSPYKTLSSKIAYQNTYLTIIEDQIIHPNGQPGLYSYQSRPDGVVVVPIDEQGNIFLIRVWRYPIQQYIWEVPMGTHDSPDELPLQAAKRELMEEAGLVADKWTTLARLHPYPSFSDGQVTHYLAQRLEQQPHTDTNEVAEVKKFSWSDIDRLIQDGQLSNGEAITALLLARQKMTKTGTA